MCPVCGAGFRDSKACLRCGADLTMVMHLQAAAWRLRQAAREALRAGDTARARVLTARARKIHGTLKGTQLEFIAAWLGENGTG